MRSELALSRLARKRIHGRKRSGLQLEQATIAGKGTKWVNRCFVVHLMQDNKTLLKPFLPFFGVLTVVVARGPYSLGLK